MLFLRFCICIFLRAVPCLCIICLGDLALGATSRLAAPRSFCCFACHQWDAGSGVHFVGLAIVPLGAASWWLICNASKRLEYMRVASEISVLWPFKQPCNSHMLCASKSPNQ
ncbi:hypothetical protein EJ04DRAFT_245218 [Polyplosphaeria fusca]|uniref:Secreted protein n=1 Tax=Polyplosphaeria fusca TaxID=682080 RepID=A0A9P4V2R0_9PLEO|nr:hypothetical protein EJ04DRAFT_245218 [Polyplosphaeria fusca]